MISETCSHLDQICEVAPGTDCCEECLKSGEEWLHVRVCESCGHVGCCDSSKNKHATRHYFKEQDGMRNDESETIQAG